MLVLTGEEDEDAELLGTGWTTQAGANPRVVSVRDGCVTLAWEDGAGEATGGTTLRDDVPDLRDGPSRGAVLDVVRERWGTDPLELIYTPDADPGDGSGWSVLVGDRFHHGDLGECLIAALEARPA